MMSVTIGLIVLFALCGGLNAAPDYKDNLLRFVSHEPRNKHDTKHYTDCHEVRHSGGYNESGIYTLHLNKSFSYQQPQINQISTLKQYHVPAGLVNFKQGFYYYEIGFGDPQGDYWAGLNPIYYLTKQGNNVLTINMQTWQGHSLELRYKWFRLNDPVQYFLEIGGYQSSHLVPDDLAFNNGMPFATFDRSDRNACAAQIHAGWWYNYCTYALPNGQFYYGPYTPPGTFYDGIYYKDWMGYGYSLRFFTMKVSRY